MAKLTMMALFSELGDYDPNNGLFSGLKAEHMPDIPVDLDGPLPPAEIAKIVRSNIIDAILDRAGELEVLYPDPEYMRGYITRTFMRWNPTFKKWARALQISYDPLNNYDRTETTTFTKRGTIVNDGNNTSTPGIITKTEEEISSYDAGTLRLNSRITGTPSGTDEATVNNTETFNTDDTTQTRVFGNIGVTTSQMMLQSELDIARFNLYNQIADVIVQEVCIMVY